MKALSSLPDGYREVDSVDLQRDKKTAILVNGLALLIAAAMVIPAALFVPFSTLFTQEDGLVAPLWKTLVLLVSLLAYMLLHELIHGIVMKALGTEKVKYGFTGMYAFAGSDDYYDKKGYIAIALAPVIFSCWCSPPFASWSRGNGFGSPIFCRCATWAGLPEISLW